MTVTKYRKKDQRIEATNSTLQVLPAHLDDPTAIHERHIQEEYI